MSALPADILRVVNRGQRAMCLLEYECDECRPNAPPNSEEDTGKDETLIASVDSKISLANKRKADNQDIESDSKGIKKLKTDEF
jgi:hypothetical protein